MTKTIWLRLAGLAGILGGLLLFAGDMLFYYHADSLDLKWNMSQASDLRIELSALTALLSTWFYLLGLFPVYQAFKPGPPAARILVLVTFGGILSAYGTIHGAYVAIAVASRLSLQYHLPMEQATALASEANQLLRWFVYPLFAVFSFVFIKQVWQRKTAYPRWILFFFPLLPFLLKGLILRVLSGTALLIIMGGFLNLILVLFFTASVIALWRPDKPVVSADSGKNLWPADS